MGKAKKLSKAFLKMQRLMVGDRLIINCHAVKIQRFEDSWRFYFFNSVENGGDIEVTLRSQLEVKAELPHRAPIKHIKRHYGDS